MIFSLSRPSAPPSLSLSMDFFEAQEHARRRTKRLVLLFVFAVIGTVLVSYGAAIFALHYRDNFHTRRSRYYVEDRPVITPGSWWNPQVFLWTACGTLTVVLLASLYKWSQMREGGSAVAEMVGGRAVDLKTTDLRERRLLNVVEEMSIASGIPMPAVYILEEEPGLNAFAAGLTTSDAAVTVTRGTLDKLTRDELQGVIGHEFSHILNGDMRLNVRITAVVFGILVIGLIGRGLLQSVGRVRTGGNKKDNSVPVILAIGLALLIIGYVGYFFGRMIQAAVSRQREFLADASAVQFTRNPASIAGSLKKIGGYALGGTIINSHAGEIGHFFFAQAFQSNFGGLWATHPPLDERIRAVEPNWDGKMFEVPEAVDIEHETFATAGFGGGQRYPANETLQRIHEAPADLPPPPSPQSRIKFTPANVMADVGALTDAHFRHAQALLVSIPSLLRDATRDANTAQALVCGLLLNGDKSSRDSQQLMVEKYAGPSVAAAVKTLRPSLSVLDPAARLPLLQLAVPALRLLEAAALDRFANTLDELVHADGIVTPFEFALQKMLLHQLRLAQNPAQRVQFDTLSAVVGEIAVVLSSFARVGSQDGVAIASAFLAGAAQLPLIATQLALLDAPACALEQVDTVLDKLAACSLPIKQQLLIAAGHVIAHDGTVTPEEGALFRALAATLDCPMPRLNPAI